MHVHVHVCALYVQCIPLSDWQRHEILQLLIWYLNQKELYYLAILLLVSTCIHVHIHCTYTCTCTCKVVLFVFLQSRQYKDFICDLTPQLSQRILCLVSGKDILLSCLVSERWYNRCTNETLWKIKCGQIQLGTCTCNYQYILCILSVYSLYIISIFSVYYQYIVIRSSCYYTNNMEAIIY